jgi:hypothetical protein
LVGYRLGTQDAPGSGGVLAQSLAPRTAREAASRATAKAGESAPRRGRAPADRSANRMTEIAPPEEQMNGWTPWGPRDRNGARTRRTPEPESAGSPSSLVASAAAQPESPIADSAAGTTGAESPVPWNGGSRVATSSGQFPASGPAGAGSRIAEERVEATASADLADALQASIEEVARRQVADEIALLAQALKRGHAPVPAAPEETPGEPQ